MQEAAGLIQHGALESEMGVVFRNLVERLLEELEGRGEVAEVAVDATAVVEGFRVESFAAVAAIVVDYVKDEGIRRMGDIRLVAALDPK